MKITTYMTAEDVRPLIFYSELATLAEAQAVRDYLVSHYDTTFDTDDLDLLVILERATVEKVKPSSFTNKRR